MIDFLKPALVAGIAFCIMSVAFKWGEGMLMLAGILMLAHAGYDIVQVARGGKDV